MQVVFWITLSLLFYTYVGYGLLLLVVNSLVKRKAIVPADALPAVTLVVPAYNEAEVIRQKIENTLALDYPQDKLSVLFVTDGSTDGSPAVVTEYPRVQLLHQTHRSGKAAAINRAMQAVQTPVVVFSDANTVVHAGSLKKLVAHFADESVGGVSGEKRIAEKSRSAVSFGERVYWQYESWLKKANGHFYTIVGAAGELFAVRTSLFRPLPADVLLDDFVLSANVCLQGYRFLYEAAAVATETSSASLAEERKRKVRISAGCYQAFFRLTALLNPFRNWRLAFQYVSHRVFRWIVCPVGLPLLFWSNFLLVMQDGGSVYPLFFWAQSVFYLLALLGILSAKSGPLPRVLLLPGYAVFMVLSQYAGFYRYITGRQPVLWEKARRQPA